MSKLRRLLLGLAAGGLLLVPSVARWTGRLSSGPAAEAQSGSTAPDLFRRVWAAPVSGFREAALSPEGDYVGVIWGYSPGKVSQKLSLWRWATRPDRPLWSRLEADASMLAVGAKGRTVLTCARMDTLHRQVSVRKGIDGARMKAQEVDGAVWDVRMSADGQYAGVTTGNRKLYLVTLGYGDTAPQFGHPWDLGGIGNSVAMTPRNTYLATGTWDQTGVSCFAVHGDGKPAWQYPNERTTPEARQILQRRLFEAQIAQDGRYVLGLSYANARRSDGTLYLWRCDGDGTPLWTHALGINTVLPKALISQDGRLVAVTYARMTTGRSRPIMARSLRVLDGDGHRQWEKGNLWFSPTLLAMAPDGHRVTVSDGVKTLYNVNENGRITSTYSFKGAVTIQHTSVSPDGHFLLVYTSDGWLHLFQVGEADANAS